MADPGQPDLIELGYVLGYMTEAQFRSMREFSTYQNRVGVPDTKADVVTRANAAYPRAVLEVLVQLNEILAGNITVPGISNVAGKSWREGDDGADVIENLDISTYGIQPPSHLWHFNGDNLPYLGGVGMDSSDVTREVAALINARGGVNNEQKFVHAGRSMYGLHRYSESNLAGIGATMAFAAFVQLSEWNQSPDGIVLASHRAYDRADETGASYRLGFELGLGYESVTATRDELALYYRHYNGSNVEVVRFPITAGSQHVALPFGREVFIAFTRTASAIDFYVNGRVYYSVNFGVGNDPSPGTAPEMRLVLGADWDGSRYLNGSMRNVAVWTGVQPSAANILNYYRVGAGFLPRVLPA